MAATGTNVRSWGRCRFSLKVTFKLFHKYEIKLEGPDGLPPPPPFAGMTRYLPASESWGGGGRQVMKLSDDESLREIIEGW